MKARELQIGDLLYYKGKFNAFPFKVESITKKKVGYHAEPNEHRMYYLRLSDCEPIPLTPEILEKNGLEKDNHGRIYGEYFDEDSNQDLEITVDDKTGEVWWSYNWNEYYIIRLRYVHQLQHALRLCGIEKEIEL